MTQKSWHAPVSFSSQLHHLGPSIFVLLSSYTSQSTNVLNLVISSNISCKSASVILFVRLGIRVFASSAVSQHKLAAAPTNGRSGQPLQFPPRPTPCRDGKRGSYVPSCDFSKGSNCGCAPSTRSTAVMFSVFLNLAKTSR